MISTNVTPCSDGVFGSNAYVKLLSKRDYQNVTQSQRVDWMDMSNYVIILKVQITANEAEKKEKTNADAVKTTVKEGHLIQK